MSGATLAEAAEALVGTRFRLHGRNPATGLDCIGLFAAAMAAIGRPPRVPNGYSLRLDDIARFRPLAPSFGFAEATGALVPGDVVMFAVGPAQFHLAIAATGGGIVHAHAGLRRVVCGPPGEDWARVGHWRLAPESED